MRLGSRGPTDEWLSFDERLSVCLERFLLVGMLRGGERGWMAGGSNDDAGSNAEDDPASLGRLLSAARRSLVSVSFSASSIERRDLSPEISSSRADDFISGVRSGSDFSAATAALLPILSRAVMNPAKYRVRSRRAAAKMLPAAPATTAPTVPALSPTSRAPRAAASHVRSPPPTPRATFTAAALDQADMLGRRTGATHVIKAQDGASCQVSAGLLRGPHWVV